MTKVYLGTTKTTHEMDVDTIYGCMNRAQSRAMVDLLRKGGYIEDLPQVDKWYAEASEGNREHMANKLIKHGYPEKGIHSKSAIKKGAYDRGFAEGTCVALPPVIATPRPLEQTFCVGDRLTRLCSKNTYMIASAGPGKVQILNLTTGQLWDKAMFVEKAYKITRKELTKLTCNSSVRFEKALS